MEKFKNGKTRTIAVICALVMIITTLMAGCGTVQKLNLDIKSSSGNSNGSDNLTWYSGDDDNADGTTVAAGANDKVVTTKSSASANYYTVNSNSVSSSQTTTKKTSTTKKTTTTTQASEDFDYVYNEFAYQRKLGFNNGYDQLSFLANMNLCNIDNYFTYGGYDWLIEFWKGEYELVTIGGEVGLYYHKNIKNGETPSHAEYQKYHYTCAENKQTMKMSMKLYQCDSDGDRVMVTCPYGNYWWMCGFATGRLKTHRKRSDLVMVASIVLPNDGMRKGFVKALEYNGFTEGSASSYKSSDKFSVSGNTVSFVWRYVQADTAK